jgi:poly(hydroxyalkanoate) depolymerase family esterase
MPIDETMGHDSTHSRNPAWTRRLRIACVTLAAAASVWPATAGAAALPGLPARTAPNPWWTPLLDWLEQFGWTLPGSRPPTPPPTGGSGQGPGASFAGSYTAGAGTRDYRGYVPSTYRQGTAMPLIVVLHGCTETADGFRQLTRFDQLAEAKGFIAVFPEQSRSANFLRCWNFFLDAHMHRGTGEPSLIAGITDWVRQHYTVDPKRIYVAGWSAGGAMASVMGASYPDLFAAVGIGSGCEYAATATCAGFRSSDPAKAAQAAYAEMGERARVLPVIAFQGDRDFTVPAINAEQLVEQWRLTADLADDGVANGSISGTPTATVDGQVPDGRAYTIRSYADDGGRELVQYWSVHGMAHAWSGGCGCAPHADPRGPDASAAMYAFLMSHPMP